MAVKSIQTHMVHHMHQYVHAISKLICPVCIPRYMHILCLCVIHGRPYIYTCAHGDHSREGIQSS